MGKILTAGSSIEQRNWLMKLVGSSHEIVDIHDRITALDILENEDYEVNLIILFVDSLGDKTYNALNLKMANSRLDSIPAIIATKHIHDIPLEDYIKHGAYDYINLMTPDMLIFKRINNIICDIEKRNPNLEAMNSYMFHHCIGAAMFLEVQGDIIRGLQINEAFFELLGFDRSEFEKSIDNLMETVIEDEVGIIKNAIQNAKEKGTYHCLVTNAESNRVFDVKYCLIGDVGDRTVFLATVEDVTTIIHSKEISDAMLQIPGIIFYDYDLKEDSIHVYISTEKGIREIHTKGANIEESGLSWISPNSYQFFLKNFNEARKEESSGSFEINARLANKTFSWHRLYYRSVANQNGLIYRIVGRIDDLESNGWKGLAEKPIGICDKETNLLTHEVVTGFMNQSMENKKEGILMLIDINGLILIKKKMRERDYQFFIRKLVKLLKEVFIPTDIMGRFNLEGFIIFLPEALSSSMAKKKAETLINLIAHYMNDWEYQCNIGISIASEKYETANNLISDANIALLEAKKQGNHKYMIFED